MALLSKFDDSFPESLLIRDVHVLYAGALVIANRPKEAVALLEKDRAPIRADLELALGRAYAAAGEPAKAVAVLRHVYFDLPLSFEATVVQSDLQKLSSTPGISPPSFGTVKSRADALARAKRFPEAADAYRDLLRAEAGWISPRGDLCITSQSEIVDEKSSRIRSTPASPVTKKAQT